MGGLKVMVGQRDQRLHGRSRLIHQPCLVVISEGGMPVSSLIARKAVLEHLRIQWVVKPELFIGRWIQGAGLDSLEQQRQAATDRFAADTHRSGDDRVEVCRPKRPTADRQDPGHHPRWS